MKTTFKLTEGDQRKEKIVEFNSSESHVICSCKKYESVGILCVHALKVLNARNIIHIPPQYILKRWKKSAKDGMVEIVMKQSANHIDCTESEQTIASPSRINRQEVPKNIMKCQLKRKYENEVREKNWGGCQGSRKGASRSYCIGENSRQSACNSPRPPLPSQATFHQIRQPASLWVTSRTAAAEKKIMVVSSHYLSGLSFVTCIFTYIVRLETSVIMEQLQKEMLKFRHENQKIFNSLNVVDSCYNQTTNKNKFICQEKSALQHEFQGIGSDKAKDLDAERNFTIYDPKSLLFLDWQRAECQAGQTEH
ncbi:hypothetical protein Pint_18472 [Pistacia integerrima]|uniref:Uncharacterized protein n=1 Tax=Pistacia integerrima TaxID=434235 RepID=A0ACC0Z110_9ROSI|nr:hypothetical protein Pint_18472 [Pistacia integerrima]